MSRSEAIVAAARVGRPVRTLFAFAAAAFIGWSAPAAAGTYVEQPVFADAVAKGELPPIDARVPAEPRVLDMEATARRTGDYGGKLRILEAQAKDVRRMVVYGYARLVVYTPDGRIVPDIVSAVDVEGDRVFTFHLRRGHRWSDGEPFTSKDFRFYWEDVIGDDELTPFGPPRDLLVDGEAPQVEILDEVTVRYSWSKPNPYFLPALANSQPLEIFRPAHYLSKFHRNYVPVEKLDAKAKEKGQRNWVARYYKYDQSYKNTNVDLPSLQPWVLKTPPPSDRFVFARNPFFHRVDTAGHQLPYIDEVNMEIVSSKLVPTKTGAGETDLQAVYLSFGNYAFLKRSEDRNAYDVRRWKSSKGSKVTLLPNLTVADPVWRELMRNADFRRALSVAINRQDINAAIYYGLAQPSNDTVLPDTEFYAPELASRWATYDPDRANALLDGIGLTRRGDDGNRLLPDGRPMTIVVETAGEDSEQVDVLELIAEDWARIGVKLLVKPSERDTLARRLAAGSTVMSVWSGVENARPNYQTSPAEFLPTASDQPLWSTWGLHFESGGSMGEAPDVPEAERLLQLNAEWASTIDPEVKRRCWREILAINADQAFRIGIVNDVDQLVVVSRRLANVPAVGIYNWNPGAFFGMYQPDGFFFADERSRQASLTP